jgi:[ribosomal protein S5]-alanine N-acetyltransferase
MKINTQRLLLRPVTLRDIPSIVKNVNNLNVSKWLLAVPYPYRTKDAKSWINHCQEEAGKKQRDNYDFGIELKSDNTLIGAIGINHISKYQGTATVGYWLGEDYWRNGYGSEALNAILNLAFKKLKLRRLEAEVFAKNPSSGKLLEKYDFQKEGFKRKVIKSKATGKIHDGIIYALLRQDYKPK